MTKRETSKSEKAVEWLPRSHISYSQAVYLNLKPKADCQHRWKPFGSKTAICARCKGVQDDE